MCISLLPFLDASTTESPKPTFFGTDTASRKQSKFRVTKKYIPYHDLTPFSTNPYQLFQKVHCNTLAEKKEKAGVEGMKT